MKTKIYFFLSIISFSFFLNLFLLPAKSLAFRLQSYPRDGRFKQLSPGRDRWYFMDEQNWYLAAPDKWQHFSGCYLGQKLLSQYLNRYFTAGLIALLGIAKEYDDAYREGWSNRDLLMDFLGIFAAMNQSKYQLYCSFDSQKIMLNLNCRLR
ncbi:MAG: hypothetical protein Q8O10_08520 [candidate division Zixibacteria bacterium]|nr:hypothetical protein [candidate division Zixibacteria bacterium]